jgi:hypothetical protein
LLARRLLAGFLLFSGPFRYFFLIGCLFSFLAFGSSPFNLGFGALDRGETLFSAFKLSRNV